MPAEFRLLFYWDISDILNTKSNFKQFRRTESIFCVKRTFYSIYSLFDKEKKMLNPIVNTIFTTDFQVEIKCIYPWSYWINISAILTFLLCHWKCVQMFNMRRNLHTHIIDSASTYWIASSIAYTYPLNHSSILPRFFGCMQCRSV